jgi:hypothetical protein
LADRFDSTKSPSQQLAAEGEEHREKISFSVKPATRQPFMSQAQRIADLGRASGNIAMLAKSRIYIRPMIPELGNLAALPSLITAICPA